MSFPCTVQRLPRTKKRRLSADSVYNAAPIIAKKTKKVKHTVLTTLPDADSVPASAASRIAIFTHVGRGRVEPPMADATMRALPANVRWVLEQKYVEQGSARWLENRGRGVTASAAAHAVNAGFIAFRAKTRYGASETSLLEKANLVVDTRAGGNASTAHGHEWELSALQHCAAAYGVEAIRVGLLVHRVHRWLGASPDGVFVDGRLVELKVPHTRAVKSGNPIPPHYWIQTQIQMEVCDAEQCIYYEFRPPSARIKEVRTNVLVVPRDRQWFNAALPLLRAYMEHMVRLQRVAALFE